jgi:hypothetical protein
MSKAVDNLKAIAKSVEGKEHLNDIPYIKECAANLINIMVESSFHIPRERQGYFNCMVVTEVLRCVYLSVPKDRRFGVMNIIRDAMEQANAMERARDE